MKKTLSALIALALSLASLPALAEAEAAEAVEETKSFSLLVNGNELTLDDLPAEPYIEGETVMVPLRKIAEALGYNVTWDCDTQSVTVDDDSIQKATLKNRSCEAVFEGHLKVINMSRTIENERETVVRDGYTYVPLAFFREFLNETIVENGVISVSPQMCELD